MRKNRLSFGSLDGEESNSTPVALDDAEALLESLRHASEVVERTPSSPDMVEVRDELAAATGVAAGEMEVSMGMSGDYEHAIELGATNVRVGSSLFGARDYKK